MRLRERELPLDPGIERELEAIDRALGGEPVEADLADLAELTRELHSERLAPDPEFAGALDERAGEGFPRPGSLEALRQRLTVAPPRRLLAASGAAATLLVAVAVGISLRDEIGGSGGTPAQPVSPRSAQPESGQAQAQAGGAAERLRPETGGAATADSNLRQALGAVDRARNAPLAPFVPPAHRKVVQQADLVLSAEPDGVRDVADGVVQVVDRYRGFVVSSSVTSGEGGVREPRPANGGVVQPAPGLPGATFRLKVPARNLQAALGDLSALAHVTSRTENIEDITHRFGAAQERVNGLEDQRDRLLRQLGEAITMEEQQSIKTRLHIVEQQLVAARRDLAGVQQRIHLVPVNVQIHGEEGVDRDSGDWSLGDAVDDAGRVLAVTAGVLLISAAVLAPLALLAALAWLGARAVLRQRRERALD